MRINDMLTLPYVDLNMALSMLVDVKNKHFGAIGLFPSLNMRMFVRWCALAALYALFVT